MESGASANNTGNPIGGGEGYTRRVDPAQSQVVRTLDELADALHAADGTPQIIYVDDAATIEIPWALKIPANVTLASGRGLNNSKGALLTRTHDLEDKQLLIVDGPSVRITGIRVWGRDEKTAESPRSRIGVINQEYDRLEIDNCELYGWTHAAIFLGGLDTIGPTASAEIHHCHIHHNQKDGNGYGIAHSKAQSIIVANRFERNRHHIQSTGTAGSNYTASFNTFHARGHKTNSTACDVHGGYDRRDQSDQAGDQFAIQYNDFNVPNSDSEPGDTPLPSAAFYPRGRPSSGAVFSNNACYGYRQPEDAIRQRFHFGNVEAYRNEFNSLKPGWFVSWGGRSPWLRIFTPGDNLVDPGQAAFGRFASFPDRRPNCQLFVRGERVSSSSEAHYWWCLRFRPDSGAFDDRIRLDLHSSPYPVADFLFGDFMAAGSTGILKLQNDRFYITTSLRQWDYVSPVGFSVGVDRSQLQVANVDLDGYTRVVKTEPNSTNGCTKIMTWSSDNTAADGPRNDSQWKLLFEDPSLPSINDIAFADWYGDRISHAMWSDGNEWKAHWSTRPSSKTATLKKWDRPYPLSDLGVGRFFHDRIADVFRIDGNDWLVSRGAREDWIKINTVHATYKPSDFYFVDLDGDGITDILRFGIDERI
ncbi:right-handed parallel beta-helix repeat-containing protein [Lacipirellula parvula]|uniref:Right handed beta helix domain-containing protein n=1 Tax=Lacipirellula parvula TaxID=2650471 RepID=A0A5K7XCS5_9BACT|nr:right-handed parallel beta-helix repeat-containing protein [Lacipirellula parvula]BBO34594.1 hypothetical protein PLANPX_4206 [Lacipirellula parvula]